MYGQKNYGQKLGNGNYTIAEAGCLLTAFCNLLTRFNISIDPPTLNTYFLNNGDYIRDGDGALEDLAWNSVSKYNANVSPTSTGTSPVPTSSNAIVKFHYNSVQTGQPIDHFCLVDHIDGTQVYIVDSWDGIVKSPAAYEPTYHTVLEWAIYAMNVPIPAPQPVVQAPTPAPPAAPVTAGNSADTYTLVVAVPGFVHASDASDPSKSNSEVPIGQYYVFNRDGSMINITRILGKPGWWINPGDNEVPSPPPIEPFVPSPPPAPAPPVDAPDPVINPNTWKDTYSPLNPDRTIEFYLALQNIAVHDLAGNNKDLPLKQYEVIPVVGTFTYNGVVYARTPNSVKNNKWYGIPMTNLSLEKDIYDTTTDTATRQVTHTLTLRDHIVLFFASLQKFAEKLSFNKKDT